MQKTLSDFSAFCKDLGLAPATILNYQADVKILSRDLVPFHMLDDQVLSKALSIFTLSNSFLDANTQARRASAINLFIHYLKSMDVISADFPALSSPVIPFMVPETTKTLIFDQILKNTDLHNFCQVRDLAIILLTFATGLKLSQIRELKRKDIILTGASSNVCFNDFYCPIYPEAVKILSLYNNNFRRFYAQSDYFFITGTGYQLSLISVTRAFSLSRFPIDDIYLTSGIVRNTFAAVLLEGGADLLTVLDILGLSSDTSIQRLEALKPKTSPNF